MGDAIAIEIGIRRTAEATEIGRAIEEGRGIGRSRRTDGIEIAMEIETSLGIGIGEVIGMEAGENIVMIETGGTGEEMTMRNRDIVAMTIGIANG